MVEVVSQFPKARPSRASGQPRRPQDWRRRTHVFVRSGSTTHDGIAICEECGFTSDHRVHDLNQSVVVEAAEIDRRRIGEGE